jgi:hypothetical protein
MELVLLAHMATFLYQQLVEAVAVQVGHRGHLRHRLVRSLVLFPVVNPEVYTVVVVVQEGINIKFLARAVAQ